MSVLLALLFVSLTAFAQSYESSVEIYFRLGSSVYEPSFKGNQSKIESFVSDVNRIFQACESPQDITVAFYGGASPEGPEALNDSLAEARLRIAVIALKNAGLDFVKFDRVAHNHSFSVEEWSKFAETVDSDRNIPDRMTVKAILSDSTLSSSDKASRLKSIRGGHGTI